MNEDTQTSASPRTRRAAFIALSVAAITVGVYDYAVQQYGWSWPWLDFAVRLPLMLLVGFGIASWCYFDGRQRGIEVPPFSFIAMGLIGIVSVPHYIWLRSEGRFSRFAMTGFGFGFFIYSYLMYLVGLYGFYGALLLKRALNPA